MKNKIGLGILCILISGFGFALMGVFIKLSGDLPAMQKGFFRNLIAMLIATIPLIKHRNKLNLPSSKKTWVVLFIRSAVGTCGLVLNFYAINNINLADASILQKLSPFITLLLSYLFFKEKMNGFQMFSILIAFFGILLIVKPDFINLISRGALSAIIGALCAGIAYTCVRYLGIKKVTGEFTIFFFSTFSCLSLLPSLIFDYHPMSLYQVIMLIFVGISATIGQFGVTYAYSFAPAKNIAAFDYAQVLFAGMMGFFIFNEIPDIYSILGYIIIITVGIMLSLKKK